MDFRSLYVWRGVRGRGEVNLWLTAPDMRHVLFHEGSPHSEGLGAKWREVKIGLHLALRLGWGALEPLAARLRLGAPATAVADRVRALARVRGF